MGKGKALCKDEPNKEEFIEAYSELYEWFMQVGWKKYCHSIHAFNYNAVRSFLERFDGKVITLADILFPVMEEFIVEATILPIDGDIWFKNKNLLGINITVFLKEENQNESWRINVKRTWLKPIRTTPLSSYRCILHVRAGMIGFPCTTSTFWLIWLVN